MQAIQRILLIEDDALIAEMLRYLLVKRGFAVQVARDGKQAAALFATDAPADLVILDAMLPYLDGFELVTRLRAQAAWANTPVIMLTAQNKEDNVIRAFHVGVDDYVVKPFQIEELLLRIRRLLRLNQPAYRSVAPAVATASQAVQLAA